MIRFGKRGKLNPRYIEPFKVLKRIGPVAYRFELPQELSGIHDVFHVLNLKKCLIDETLAVPLEELHITDKLQFIEGPLEIIDREVKTLKHNRIPIVKVRWNSRRGPEFTWEHEDEIKRKFTSPSVSTIATDTENIGYWQELNPYDAQAPVEEVATSPTKNKKKVTRNRQKRTSQSSNAPRQTLWTTEEEIALCKGWLAVSENSKDGNAKKQSGFWVEVLEYIESKTKQHGRRTRAGDEYYVQRAMVHYEIDTGVAFKPRHWSGGSKKHKKFDQRAGTKRELQRGKRTSQNRGSTSNVNEDALARLMVTEMTTQEKEERLAFLDIKMREVECREREMEQQDMRFYLKPYDHLTGDQRNAMDEIRAKIKAKYNL
ncbi:hypothetical protein Tco_0321148 [Tanacetum coccineum]